MHNRADVPQLLAGQRWEGQRNEAERDLDGVGCMFYLLLNNVRIQSGTLIGGLKTLLDKGRSSPHQDLWTYLQL